MPLRAACILLTALALTAAVSATAVGAQTKPPNLEELWEQYPLEAPPDEERRVGEREKRGSLAGPPPKPAEPAGPLFQALLIVALVLGLVGLAVGVRRGLALLRERRREREPKPERERKRERPGRLGAGAGDLGG